MVFEPFFGKLDIHAAQHAFTVFAAGVDAHRLADLLRGRGIPVVLGGPHVTLIPDDAQPHADAIVAGYAEDTWPQLLRDFAAGQMKPRYIMDPDISLAHRPFPKREMMKKQNYELKNERIREAFQELRKKTRAARSSRRLNLSWSNWGFGLEPLVQGPQPRQPIHETRTEKQLGGVRPH